ncbi:MAG: endonuclease/exonuclease/phosphatase family protein [Prevotellaceae bacterium]|nr:endonuclease/exonuclease/phosphatase family protein [Prevotellaceae bacterium]
MKIWLKNTLIILNIIVALCLLMSYLSMQINPKHIWFLSFFGLLFFVFFPLNVGFLIFWIVYHKYYFIISLLSLALGYNTLQSLVSFSSKVLETQGKRISILSYNVNLLGLRYKRNEEIKFKPIAEFVNKGGFDIACLQEFFMQDGDYNEETFNALLSNYPYRYNFYNLEQKNGKFGIATYSKYPIINKGHISFQNTVNMAIFTDVEVDSQTIVRCYNVHLQSVKFLNKERETIMDETYLLKQSGKKELMKNMSGKLKDAFVKRAEQVEVVSEHISNSPYPVIICGDFNDTPISYAYHTMRGNLRDGFMDAGRGIMSTYRSILPSLRIDYIFYDRQFRASAYYCPNVVYSDHYPLVCKISK